MGRAVRGAGAVGVLALVLLPLVGACGTDEDAPRRGRNTISREAFVATYVALRRGALESETGRIGDEERERVLAEHGITEDDLLTFVEVHGRRIDFMRDVWNEVEERLLGQEGSDPSGADTAGVRPPGLRPERQSGPGL